MPFTIGGDWIPEPSSKQTSKPIKIRKEKRRASVITVIQNIPYESSRLKELCTAMKKRIGCGGSVKNDCIELQGDQVESVKQFLREENLKVH